MNIAPCTGLTRDQLAAINNNEGRCKILHLQKGDGFLEEPCCNVNGGKDIPGLNASHIRLPCRHQVCSHCIHTFFEPWNMRVCPECRDPFGAKLPNLPFPKPESPESWMEGFNAALWASPIRNGIVWLEVQHRAAVEAANSGILRRGQSSDDVLVWYDRHVFLLIAMTQVLRKRTQLSRLQHLQLAFVIKAIGDVFAKSWYGLRDSASSLLDALDGALLERLEQLLSSDPVWQGLLPPLGEWECLHDTNDVVFGIIQQATEYALYFADTDSDAQ